MTRVETLPNGIRWRDKLVNDTLAKFDRNTPHIPDTPINRPIEFPVCFFRSAFLPATPTTFATGAILYPTETFIVVGKRVPSCIVDGRESLCCSKSSRFVTRSRVALSPESRTFRISRTFDGSQGSDCEARSNQFSLLSRLSGGLDRDPTSHATFIFPDRLVVA